MKEKEEKDRSMLAEPVASYGSNYTYADYLKFEFEEMVELIRGKIFKMSPAPSSYHQLISGNLFFEIRKMINNTNGCSIFVAPLDVILSFEEKKEIKSRTVVQPDLCIICDPSKIKKAGCFGAPDLVIEIISEHTSKKDLNNKYSVYEEAGVREYWIVFPKEEIIEVYVLEGQKFARKRVFVKEEEITSYIFPELRIDLTLIFPNPFE